MNMTSARQIGMDILVFKLLGLEIDHGLESSWTKLASISETRVVTVTSLSHRAASVHQFTTSEQTSYANFKLY